MRLDDKKNPMIQVSALWVLLHITTCSFYHYRKRKIVRYMVEKNKEHLDRIEKKIDALEKTE